MKKRGTKKKHTVSSGEKISKKIILDFLRFNVFFYIFFNIWFLIVYLAAQQYSVVRNYIFNFFTTVTTVSFTKFLFAHSYILVVFGCVTVFIITCFVYSISTLINFDKTWLSLSALNSDEDDVRKFSQNYSEVEIKLKDIKHDVFKNKQTALSAEMRKNDLVMYLAHDLKTPLTSIIGYLSLLNDCPELPTEQKAKYIGITLDKAYRLEQLINEFFEITRFNINSIKLERNRIDIGMMLYQITEEFYPMLREKNVEIKIDLKDKIMIFADSDKLARVFDNLLKNAVNYCYENTQIKIGARVVESKVIIKFRNYCDEIPPDKLERLFEKFFRLDSSRSSATGGSGLGLAISKQIIELHGGQLIASSNKNYTEFTIALPFEDASHFFE